MLADSWALVPTMPDEGVIEVMIISACTFCKNEKGTKIESERISKSTIGLAFLTE
jgi:hypothetical protein